MTFIRYTAVTDGSPVGIAALAYYRSLVRILPVQLMSMSGLPSGPWVDVTNPNGWVGDPRDFINCVCTHASQWEVEFSIPMPASDDMHASDAKVDGYARGIVELYTKGVRNVLFIVGSANHAQLKAAARYDQVVTPAFDAAIDAILTPYQRQPWSIEIPVTRHDLVRAAVLGEALKS